MKCIRDDGECGTGGYCAKCPFPEWGDIIDSLRAQNKKQADRIAELEQDRDRWKGRATQAALALNDYADMASEWGQERDALQSLLAKNCPQCQSTTGIKFPREGSPYCEDCGWPDEDFEGEEDK